MTTLNDNVSSSQAEDTIIIETDTSSTFDLSNITLNNYNWNTSMSNWPNAGAIGNSNITFSTTANNYGSTLYTTGGSSGLHVSSDASFDGDIKWKGKSLGDMIEKIHDRLAILTPDLEKLAHFAALKKAYDNYKMLEALCEVPKEEEDGN
jgi:hypothetical protein